MNGSLTFLRVLSAFAILWIGFYSSELKGQVVIDQVGQFENYAFGNLPESAVKKKLQSQFELEIKKMVLSCDLTEAQQEKIRFAAQGDISRFFRLVDKTRKSTEALNMNDQEQAQKFWQLASPIQSKLQTGLNTADSLFRKSIEQILEPEQQEKLAKREEEINSSRMAVYIKLRIAKIERQVPLVSNQRESLIDMIESTLKGKKIPQENIANITDIVIGGFSDEKLGKILDEDQLAAIRKVVQNTDGMRQQLARKGIKLE